MPGAASVHGMDTTPLPTRPLGDRAVSALGMGCWAIGGPWRFDGRAAGWGAVDDEESVAAIRRALDLGVTLFDTADVYGCGHSERVLGRALGTRRDDVVIATKFGNTFEEGSGRITGSDVSAAYIRRACEASLRRLGTDRIDLYQLHGGVEDRAGAEPVIEVLEALVAEGKVLAYGPSVNDPEVVAAFAEAPHCVAVQQQMNVFGVDEPLLAVCEERGLAAVARSPLAMGLLSGRYGPGAGLPPAGDVRRDTPYWDYFDEDRIAGWTARVEAIREVLTADGRSLVQGALAWIWARSPVAIPIPGFRTVAQVEENVAAARLDPLDPGALAAVAAALAPSASPAA